VDRAEGAGGDERNQRTLALQPRRGGRREPSGRC